MKARRACELCSGVAALHCASDSAFLCWACDAHVHGANFLVARHARRLLCPECGSFDDDDLPVYGPGCPTLPSLCRTCHGGGGGGGGAFSDSESSACSSSSLASSMSSSCVSSVESGQAACSGNGRGVGIAAFPADGDGPIKATCSANSGTDSECSDSGRARRRRRRSAGCAAALGELDARADVVLASWCRRLGLEGGCAVGAASHALGAAARRMGAVPFRVCAAAAVWFAAKLCCAEAARGGWRGAALLKRLEACSGVPAKLILAAEARLSRAVRRRQVDGEGEGWAECC